MANPGNSASSRDVATLLHPQTNFRAHEKQGAVVIARGEGVRVFDEDGKDYIEGMAGLWCASLGFSEKRLADAATRQLNTLPYYHIYNHKSHDPGIELAERLLALMPVPMSKVFFANSGSEANDTVIRLVWYYNNALGRPKKKKFVSRQRAFHGSTLMAGSLTGLPALHREFDLPLGGVVHTDCPHHYRGALPGESEEDFATRLAENLEKLIIAEGGAETCAAFIAEPVMGAGGVVVPPRTYFEKIQKVVKKYDMLMVADEVICGFGRTGNMFGSETFGIQPDILVVAKGLSSAYLPISGIAISDPVYQAIADNSAKVGMFGHGFTYSAHPVAAAVAVETLRIYEERDILTHIRAVAPVLQDGLRRFADHPLVGEVRGVGLVGAIELVRDKATKEAFRPDERIGPRVAKAAETHGLIIRAMGDSIGFSPPLIITADEIDQMLARFRKGLDEVWAEMGREAQKSAA
ncbi:4-aminobutyrate--pyruvate transaminase [Stella humosa]|uniref:4-aminobutyrate--pyruvate transaminase n=1 Tax=Stella humosa TaxID=94 RepID=A0A3N1MFZ6_9PROT|nr:aspartate aminotransferase family protein [Stella humosa]ROQ01600.1 4-aminobutyrate--pyruvate transaminase [Stella humosa]BBK31981.1 aspartate aminotransferase family protein [Stella humosa]